ncbi:MAG: hypothetical protein ABJO02_12440 [Reichenbachiella sp.]|uniref:DUF6989 domain-containing protein n=1 Tax=Reichenbachiella sp. TaxID=2184521 RepID=UPI0032989948
METEKKLIAGLDKKTTLVILISSGVLVGWSLISSVMNLGPITASIITYSLYGFYWFYAIRYKNPLVLRLVIFGTVAGILELATDHYLVETINSLVYPGKELMIWSSPAYMPFAWSNVILQLGFIGVLLTRRFGILKASLILGLAGGMYIPLYEHLANNAGWWWYKNNTLMVFNAPVYVIVCEALISLSLPILIQNAEEHSLKKTLSLGAIEGIWILVSAFLAFSIAG